MLDPHHPALTRRVHELVAADGDADVRCARGRRFEKNTRSPGLKLVVRDRTPLTGLIRDFARHPDAVLREDVSDEAAAVEARRVGAAVPVRRTAQRERRSDDGVASSCREPGSARCGRRAASGG